MLGLSTAAAASFAAGADTFRNGESLYGHPSGEATNARVVDVGGSTVSIAVPYGETVTFRSDGQRFTWTFDGLDRRAVDIAKIAPAGFPAKPLTIYVGRSIANRK